MAGTRHPTPRILRIMAMSGASHFPGFTTWCFATAHPGAGWQESKPAKYRPQFFSEREYALLERLTELIILSDETPGAKDAGVAEFVHFMVAHDPDKQYKFRTGITWLNAHLERLKGQPFVELSQEQQVSILESLAYKAKYRAGEEDFSINLNPRRSRGERNNSRWSTAQKTPKADLLLMVTTSVQQLIEASVSRTQPSFQP